VSGLTSLQDTQPSRLPSNRPKRSRPRGTSPLTTAARCLQASRVSDSPI
jgi:hypothetical protein